MDFDVYFVLLSAILMSFTPVLVKTVTLGPIVTGAYRCLIGSLVLLPFCLWQIHKKKQQIPPLSDPIYRLLLLAGVTFTLVVCAWQISILITGAGLSTLLAHTQALYLLMFGYLIRKESPSSTLVLSLGAAAIGLFMILRTKPEWASSDNFALGVFLGLMTGLLNAGFVLCLRRVNEIDHQFSMIQKLSVICFISAICLFGVSHFYGDLEVAQGSNLAYVILLGICANVLGWGFASIGLPKISVSLSGLLLLAQPILALVWGYLTFSENLTPIQCAGIVLVLMAIYWGTARPVAVQPTATISKGGQ